MIVDRTHRGWMAGCGVIGAGAALAYAWYAVRAPNGPTGGSIPGLAFGFAGAAVILYECLLSVRKKYPASPLGRVETWLKAHVWLGLVSFLLILFHAGFQWGEGLARALMWLFVVVAASGVYGLVLQGYLPRRMTELVTRETIYEQIPEVIRLLRLEADERMEFLTADTGVEEEEPERLRAGGRKHYFDAAQRKSAGEKMEAERQKRRESPQIPVDPEFSRALKAHYLQEIRPFLAESPGRFARRLFATAPAVTAYFQYLRTLMPVAAHDVLHDLESICEERRQLEVQERLHRWLHGWLYVHVPLSMALLVLMLAHAVVSLRY